MAAAIRPPSSGELDVVPAGDDQDRHGQLVQPVPQRVLGSGPGRPETRGQSGPGVAQPLLQSVAVVVDPREERALEPSADERLHRYGRRRGGRRRVELGGQRLVGPATRPPLVRVLDAGRPGDEHQALDQIRSGQGQVQAVPGAHRVAEVAARPAGVAEPPGSFGERAGQWCRPRVPGHVQGHHLMVAGQVEVDRAPDPGGLGEAVGQDQALGPARGSRRATTMPSGAQGEGSRAAAWGTAMSVATPAADAGDADLQAAFAATLVDEWVRCGVDRAVVCPGSRSTPLVVQLAAHPGMTVHVRLDERAAGFTALGMGLATGRPALVVTTSGTAAAELHASVVEADLSGVPLIACTADRPPELHDVGAPQTIDQARLFGTSPRWFADPGVPDARTRSSWRSLAARAVGEATAGADGPGPVHLNLPFREPLLGDPRRAAIPEPRPVRWGALAPGGPRRARPVRSGHRRAGRLRGAGPRLPGPHRGRGRVRRPGRGVGPESGAQLAGPGRSPLRAAGPRPGGGRRRRRHPAVGAVRRRPPARMRAPTG